MDPNSQIHDAPTPNGKPNHDLSDPCLFKAIEEYLAEIEAGHQPDRAAFLARHADIAGQLSGCLAALEAVQGSARSCSEAGLAGNIPTLEPGTILGGFCIVREVGHGGMGVVYLALDEKLNRPVALKVMGPNLAADAVARKRFLREGQTTAAIRHPHIITIYQVGEDRGLPFLAMEFLHGETLEARLHRHGPLPLSDALRIIREVADGLAVAHEHGLIHRDIKPGNIFLEIADCRLQIADLEPDEPLRSAISNEAPSAIERVKILDFGLACNMDGEGRLTQTGVAIGTPHYMSPEQAAGDAVDHRSDLFSLGCVLYRLLTGTSPFTGANLRATFRSVLLEAPKSPREVNHDIPLALAELTLRLLAKDPGDRPHSAQAVSATLRTIAQELASRGTGSAPPLADTDITPSPRPPRRLLVTFALILGLLLLGLSIGYFAYHSWLDDGNARDDPPGAGKIVGTAPNPPKKNQPDLKPPVAKDLDPPPARPMPQRTWPAGGPVAGVAFCPPAGKLLATVTQAGYVRLWDLEGTEIFSHKIGASMRGMASSGQGRYLVVTDPQMNWVFDVDDALRTPVKFFHRPIWQILKARPELERPEWGKLAITPDGNWLVQICTSADKKTGCVGVRQLLFGKTMDDATPLGKYNAPVHQVACSLAGKIATVAPPNVIRLWDVQGNDLGTLPITLPHVQAVAFAGEKTLAVAGKEAIELWDLKDLKKRLTLTASNGKVGSLACSFNGKLLAWVDGSMVRVHEIATGRELATLSTPSEVTALNFSYDSHYLVTGSDKGTISLWDALSFGK